MSTINIFLYLQLLDFLTTLVGLKLGAKEMSPFVAALMRAGPGVGVAVSKCLAVILAGICMWAKKDRLIRWVTYWYGGLVVWNLVVMLAA
jgi:hypothetical protein